ncbi:MAG: hypothetical protein P9M15_03320 [Candidatus Electryoneaceae bacterium]|nr:hypothetical protein [Candidatus Electryoneaceae bacterium]
MFPNWIKRWPLLIIGAGIMLSGVALWAYTFFYQSSTLKTVDRNNTILD